MTFSSIFAQFVAFIGGIALQWRKMTGTEPAPAWGQSPAIPEAKPQGAIPTLKMPTARGWRDGQKPTVAPGLKVNAFATGLDHPRWIEVLPNGDVLIAEATQIAGAPRSVFHYAMQATMRRAAALGVSAGNSPSDVRPGAGACGDGQQGSRLRARAKRHPIRQRCRRSAAPSYRGSSEELDHSGRFHARGVNPRPWGHR